MLPTDLGHSAAPLSSSIASSSALSSSTTLSLQHHQPVVASSAGHSSSSASSGLNSHSPQSVVASTSAASPMFQVAMEKFKAPTADFTPRINNTWVTALYRVDPDVKRVRDHPDRTLLRGYALLDPHAFLRSTSRLHIYTACWLMIRPLWINLAINRQADQNGDCSPYPEPQDWKGFLFEDRKSVV